MRPAVLLRFAGRRAKIAAAQITGNAIALFTRFLTAAVAGRPGAAGAPRAGGCVAADLPGQQTAARPGAVLQPNPNPTRQPARAAPYPAPTATQPITPNNITRMPTNSQYGARIVCVILDVIRANSPTQRGKGTNFEELFCKAAPLIPDLEVKHIWR